MSRRISFIALGFGFATAVVLSLGKVDKSVVISSALVVVVSGLMLLKEEG